jgi:hypothetical protein
VINTFRWTAGLLFFSALGLAIIREASCRKLE